MKTAFIRAAAGAVALVSGLAAAQTYSTYPNHGYSNAPARVVRCESIRSDRNFCRVDTRGGVQLYRQLSRANCIRGRDWDVRRDGIVVDDGCRAEFVVGSGYASTVRYDRYGRPIYDNRYGSTSGYATDRYGRPIYDNRTPTYSNGGYAYDRYGNRVYVGNSGSYNGGYTTDRYGNRVPVGTYGSGTNGYYTTDRYGNRVFVRSSGDGRTYDDGYDDGSDTYYRNVELGPPGGSTYQAPTTYGAGMADTIHCQPSPMGRTYCGDRTRTYTMRIDSGSNCILNQTYGRDSYGTWVSGSCSMRLEGTGQ